MCQSPPRVLPSRVLAAAGERGSAQARRSPYCSRPCQDGRSAARGTSGQLLRAALLGTAGSGRDTVLAHHQILEREPAPRQQCRGTWKLACWPRFSSTGETHPSHIMTRLTLHELRNHAQESWLLGGFPRTLAQAEALDRVNLIHLVKNPNVPFEVIRERLTVHPPRPQPRL